MVTDIAAIVRLGNPPALINKKVRRNAVDATLYTPREISLPQHCPADFGQALAPDNEKADPTVPNTVALIECLFGIRDQEKRKMLSVDILS